MSGDLDQLQAYHEFLLAADIDDRTEFQRAIAEAQSLLGMSSADLARFCKCASPTVEMWRTGETAPYHGMRKVIFERLAEAALAEHRRREGSG